MDSNSSKVYHKQLICFQNYSQDKILCMHNTAKLYDGQFYDIDMVWAFPAHCGIITMDIFSLFYFLHHPTIHFGKVEGTRLQ